MRRAQILVYPDLMAEWLHEPTEARYTLKPSLEDAHRVLLLPDSFTVKAVEFDYSRAVYRVYVESELLPEAPDGNNAPVLTVCHRTDSQGQVRLHTMTYNGMVILTGDETLPQERTAHAR